MEDDLIFNINERRPNFFGKWKTTSIFKMEDNLIFLLMEDNLNGFSDGHHFYTVIQNMTETLCLYQIK